MGYRDATEAAGARIEALEHEVHVLRASAAVAAAPDPSRLTTPRERALTHELAVARGQIEALRCEGGRPPPRSRSSIAIAVFGIVVLGVGVLVLLAIAGEHAAHRARQPHAAVTQAPTPTAPPLVAPAAALEAVCDAPAR